MKTVRELQIAIVEAAIAWEAAPIVDNDAEAARLIGAVSELLADQDAAMLAAERRNCDGPSLADDVCIWITRPVRNVRADDVIRMVGRPETERVVESASPPLDWHVHPKASQYAPNESPAEWSEIKVRLRNGGEVETFSFKPAMEVEIRMTGRNRDALEALGLDLGDRP